MFGAFTDIVVNREANDTAAEFVRKKIRGIVPRSRRWPRSSSERLPDRDQASLRRYRLLRNVQSGQRDADRHAGDADRRDHGHGPRTRTRV